MCFTVLDKLAVGGCLLGEVLDRTSLLGFQGH